MNLNDFFHPTSTSTYQKYNKYIDKKAYEDLKNSKIELKKREKVFLEDSRYYVEEVRKGIVEQLGYDKVYKEGLNIKTPLNLTLQEISSSVLRDGIENYDKRKGWRGPITNINYTTDWFKKINKKNFLEYSIGWKIAIIRKYPVACAVVAWLEGIIIGILIYHYFMMDVLSCCNA